MTTNLVALVSIAQTESVIFFCIEMLLTALSLGSEAPFFQADHRPPLILEILHEVS